MARKPRPEKSTAEVLIGVSKSYQIAARRLTSEVETFAQVAPAFYLLGSYAMELAFKALYKKRGNATEDDLHNLGHDLKAAYNKAIGCGLHERLWSADVPIMVGQLHDHHVQNNFRYAPAEGDPLKVPHPDMLMRTLDALLKEVDTVVFGAHEQDD